MKNFYFLLVFLCVVISACGQSKQVLELQNQFWNSGDERKEIKTVPEKWKGESAVILYLEEYFEYTNFASKAFYPSYYHERVLLQDKAAIENFSEFSFGKEDKDFGLIFHSYQEKTILGAKIIKPDGTEIILNIDNEKVVQDDRIKVAIPNLEVGDILDFFVYQDDYGVVYGGEKIFEAHERVLSMEYPVVYRKLAIELEKGRLYLNMDSYNDAPEILEVPTDKNSRRRYMLEANDIEKSDFPRWFYPLVELPTVKFQVIYSVIGKNSDIFMGENAAERKTHVSPEELVDYYDLRFKTYKSRSVAPVLDYLEEKEITDKREQLVQALYFMRHRNYNRFIELYLARENQIEGFDVPCGGYAFIDEDNFVNFMASLGKELEIDYDIVVATPDFNGSIDDLLLASNVSLGLRFNFPKPLYFFHISSHVQAELFPENLEGTKVYLLGVKKNRKIENAEIAVLPVTTAQDNIEKKMIAVNFRDGFNSIHIERNLEFTGHFKIQEQGRWLFFDDYLNEEFERFDSSHFYHCRKNQNRKEEEAEQKLKSFYAEIEKRHNENLKERIKNVYDVETKDYAYEIKNSARYSEEALVVADSFNIENEFIRKAGPNYLFELGKLIGGQVKIEKDEEERVANIDLDFAKTLIYNVEISVPEGFEVVGVEKLNRTITNETGSFEVVAKVENGILKYTATKIYAKPHYEAAEWGNMLVWLKAAHDFSQEKVMFKKL
ncbi:MAG TPA: hypothetical protein VFM82_11600 [Flavobacteriaceae bacterium]|nr:hypothetical protein [Flavobacteriaceae bacterium]